MCDEAFGTCLFVFDSVPDWCKTKEICDKIDFGAPFLLKYCHDRCSAQEMSDKAVNDFFISIKICSRLVCYK